VEDKFHKEISRLDRLDSDDIKVLFERQIQKMRRAAERRAQGHCEYAEVPETDFITAAKASERLACHIYCGNWSYMVRSPPSSPSHCAWI
jgi:hypothetical protein